MFYGDFITSKNDEPPLRREKVLEIATKLQEEKKYLELLQFIVGQEKKVSSDDLKWCEDLTHLRKIYAMGYVSYEMHFKAQEFWGKLAFDLAEKKYDETKQFIMNNFSLFGIDKKAKEEFTVLMEERFAISKTLKNKDIPALADETKKIIAKKFQDQSDFGINVASEVLQILADSVFYQLMCLVVMNDSDWRLKAK